MVGKIFRKIPLHTLLRRSILHALPKLHRLPGRSRRISHRTHSISILLDLWAVLLLSQQIQRNAVTTQPRQIPQLPLRCDLITQYQPEFPSRALLFINMPIYKHKQTQHKLNFVANNYFSHERLTRVAQIYQNRFESNDYSHKPQFGLKDRQQLGRNSICRQLIVIQKIDLSNKGRYCFDQQMSSQIKVHRRNKAVEQEEELFRMSVPPLEINHIRRSFGPLHNPTNHYRASDLAQLHLLTPRTKPAAKPQARKGEEVGNQKTGKKLLATFTDLRVKLAQAKKQLAISTQKQLSQFSFELKSYGSGSSGENHKLGDSIFQKMQESTINLESNKKLIEAVQSKERIVWATKIKTYYLKEIVQGIIGINERALEHIAISHQILKSVPHMDLPNDQTLPRIKMQLPMAPEHLGKKVLVVDLDETLFHCQESRNSPQDMEIDIPVDNGFQKVYISIRPYAISFLKRCSKYFEIIAFTASEKCYADAILNEIDPDRQYIQHRLYREHCVKLHNKVYAKDLSIINRDLSKMVLVDNSPLSFLYQVENAIPILPYHAGEDSELLLLEKYLDRIRLQKDVRKLNLQTFKLHQYGCFEDYQSLVKQLYCNNSNDY